MSSRIWYLCLFEMVWIKITLVFQQHYGFSDDQFGSTWCPDHQERWDPPGSPLSCSQSAGSFYKEVWVPVLVWLFVSWVCACFVYWWKEWKSFLFPFVMCSLVQTESFWMFGSGGSMSHLPYIHTYLEEQKYCFPECKWIGSNKIPACLPQKLKTCWCSQQCARGCSAGRVIKNKCQSTTKMWVFSNS